jgi:hypothetical protein
MFFLTFFQSIDAFPKNNLNHTLDVNLLFSLALEVQNVLNQFLELDDSEILEPLKRLLKLITLLYEMFQLINFPSFCFVISQCLIIN